MTSDRVLVLHTLEIQTHESETRVPTDVAHMTIRRQSVKVHISFTGTA